VPRAGADARLRITGGQARGRVLALRVPDGVRPTAARVREALFSIVGHDLDGVRVLDAYGGTGLLGLEAWSRGARVTIAERDVAVAQLIRKNVAAMSADIDVVTGDVLRAVEGLGPFQLAFVDPPYRMDAGPILRVLARAPIDRIVLEHDAATEPPDPEGLERTRTRVYGGTGLTVYDRPEAG
jgi:16S rRNA (guanine966-N2)-methyltransferase